VSHHGDDKHDKKKKQREKNRRDWIIFQQADLLRENVDIGAPSREAKTPEKAGTPEEKLWSAKLSSVRNRLDNSRRVSQERWNRFAGTSDGGGRGR
jgi:hypothetical protein